jgi:hypothetical protein
MPKALSKTSFQPSHLVDYGLKISAQDPKSTAVVSAVCQFYTVFGREEKIGGKRARTKNVKYFSTFWTDGYKLHLSTSHAEKWEEYQNIKSAEDKEEFFSSALVAFGNTLHAHLESASHCRVLIHAKIVEDEIADLLFHQDDIEGVTQKRAMALLKKLKIVENMVLIM